MGTDELLPVKAPVQVKPRKGGRGHTTGQSGELPTPGKGYRCCPIPLGQEDRGSRISNRSVDV